MDESPNVNLNNIVSERKIEQKKLTVPNPLKRGIKKRESKIREKKHTFGFRMVTDCLCLYFRT